MKIENNWSWPLLEGTRSIIAQRVENKILFKDEGKYNRKFVKDIMYVQIQVDAKRKFPRLIFDFRRKFPLPIFPLTTFEYTIFTRASSSHFWKFHQKFLVTRANTCTRRENQKPKQTKKQRRKSNKGGEKVTTEWEKKKLDGKPKWKNSYTVSHTRGRRKKNNFDSTEITRRGKNACKTKNVI